MNFVNLMQKTIKFAKWKKIMKFVNRSAAENIPKIWQSLMGNYCEICQSVEGKNYEICQLVRGKKLRNLSFSGKNREFH